MWYNPNTLKVYFTAAIAQKETFGKYYDIIVQVLLNKGHQVQHEHITDGSIDKIQSEDHEETSRYYRRMLKRLTDADLVVAEASFPSTINVGHEITLALEKGKPVVVLYKKGHDPVLFHGINSERLVLLEYTDMTLADSVVEAIEFAKDRSDTRFNFFISPALSHYLDWITQHKKVPRSVYLRQLIEDDRDKNKDYS